MKERGILRSQWINMIEKGMKEKRFLTVTGKAMKGSIYIPSSLLLPSPSFRFNFKDISNVS